MWKVEKYSCRIFCYEKCACRNIMNGIWCIKRECAQRLKFNRVIHLGFENQEASSNFIRLIRAIGLIIRIAKLRRARLLISFMKRQKGSHGAFDFYMYGREIKSRVFITIISFSRLFILDDGATRSCTCISRSRFSSGYFISPFE